MVRLLCVDDNDNQEIVEGDTYEEALENVLNSYNIKCSILK